MAIHGKPSSNGISHFTGIPKSGSTAPFAACSVQKATWISTLGSFASRLNAGDAYCTGCEATKRTRMGRFVIATMLPDTAPQSDSRRKSSVAAADFAGEDRSRFGGHSRLGLGYEQEIRNHQSAPIECPPHRVEGSRFHFDSRQLVLRRQCRQARCPAAM